MFVVGFDAEKAQYTITNGEAAPKLYKSFLGAVCAAQRFSGTQQAPYTIDQNAFDHVKGGIVSTG